MIQVSVVIVNYNTFELTCNCIRSVIEKTRDVSFEIILVDNASGEVSASRFKEVFSDIVLIESPLNLGFAGGCNLGISNANGEYVLLLNSDTILMNNAILICLDFLQRDSSVAVVSSRLEYPNGKPQHNCQRLPSIRYGLFELLRLQKFLPKRIGGKILLGSFFDFNEVVYPDWVWGTFFMFKRNILLGLNDHKLADVFFMYGEDIQWCIEFKKLGYRIAFEPAAIVIHLMGQSGASKTHLINQNMQILMGMYFSTFHQKCISIIERLLK